jgi:uncharacterized protein YtpQ (UPF0354 family)
MPGLRVEVVGEKELRITDPMGKESTAFLDNAYTEYRQHPKDLSAVIQKFSAALVESSREDESIDRSRIVPVVKDRNWIKEIQESTKSRGVKGTLENVFDDFNEELVVVYAEDNPKTVRYLTPEKLANLGIERGELRALAVENLKRLIPQVEVLPGPEVSMVKADGDYEASLVLFDELWASPQIRVDGDIVVAVPSRGVLLFTGSRNPAGIAKLRELAAQDARKSPYHLTAELFVYRNGSFKRLPQL